MKTTEFNGKTFEVPDWTRYLTLDNSGVVTAWEQAPRSSNGFYFRVYEKTRYEVVGRMKFQDRYKEIT